MKRSLRTAPAQYETDEQFSRLVAMLKACPQAYNEVNLAAENLTDHYPAPEVLAKRLELLRRRIDALHHAGVRSVGLTVGWTLGHGDVGWSGGLNDSWGHAVGHDGKVSRCCPCPNDPGFRAYIAEKYQILAEIHPDFIDADDDVRMNHHGPAYPCFCPTCLGKFQDGRWDREALVDRLNDPAGGTLREAWVEHNATVIEGLLREIGEAVRAVAPDVALGLMTVGPGHSTYSGQAYSRWMAAMGATRGRPGHGFYDDQRPRGMLYKALEVGRQVRGYHSDVTSIMYEMENYPHIPLDKSTRALLDECTLALVMGCNDLTFALPSLFPGKLDDYEKDTQAIAQHGPIWEALVDACRGTVLSGLWPADHDRLMARREVRSDGWFREDGPYDIHGPDELLELGMPFSTDSRTACGTVLSGRIAEAFSDDELREILTGGVMMDSAALEVLWERSLGELTGVRPGRKYDDSIWERLTDHPWNGDDAGDGRNAMISSENPACTLAHAADVEDLAHLMDWSDSDLGMCLSAHTNDLGGRVVVTTYSPWRRLGRGAKMRQLQRLANWISGGQLPILIDTTARVAPFIRVNEDRRRFVAVLLNNSLDSTGPLPLRLRVRSKQVAILESSGEKALPVKRRNNEMTMTVPDIPAWHCVILIGR